MMDQWVVQLILGYVVGAVLGSVYFGGLWASVQWLARASHPVASMTLGLVVRLGVAILVFYWLLTWSVVAMMAALAGFLSVRLLIFRSFRESGPKC